MADESAPKDEWNSFLKEVATSDNAGPAARRARAGMPPEGGTTAPETPPDPVAGWHSLIPDTFNASHASAALTKAINDTRAAINSQPFQSTQPPPQAMNPELYDALVRARQMRDGFDVIAQKLPGKAWNKSGNPVGDALKQTGAELYGQIKKAFPDAEQEEIHPRGEINIVKPTVKTPEKPTPKIPGITAPPSTAITPELAAAFHARDNGGGSDSIRAQFAQELFR
jgi:hypothetical protein